MRQDKETLRDIEAALCDMSSTALKKAIRENVGRGAVYDGRELCGDVLFDRSGRAMHITVTQYPLDGGFVAFNGERVSMIPQDAVYRFWSRLEALRKTRDARVSR